MRRHLPPVTCLKSQNRQGACRITLHQRFRPNAGADFRHELHDEAVNPRIVGDNKETADFIGRAIGSSKQGPLIGAIKTILEANRWIGFEGRQ